MEGLNQKQPIQESVGFFKLFRFAKKTDILLMVVGGIAAVANGIAQPLISQFIGKMSDQFSASANQTQIVENARDQCIYMVLVGVASFFFSWIQMGCWMISGERQSIECRKEYFKAMIKQEIGWFDLQNPNELTSKVSQDCFFLQGAIGEKVPTFIMTIFMTIGGFGVAFWNGWQMSLVAIAGVPAVVLGALFFTIILQQTSIKTSQAYLKAGAQAEQGLNSIKTIKSLTGEQFEIKSYSKSLIEAFKIATKYSVWSGLGLGIAFFTLYLDYGLCFWYGSKLIEDGTTNTNFNRVYSQGDIVIIFLAIIIGGQALGQAGPCLKNFSLGQIAAAKIFKLLDRVPLIRNCENPRKINNLKGHIILKDIEFSYPSKKDVKVHNNLNIVIKPNQKTALVGESGCGKSTVMQLIERFYDPDSGSITIDGQDIKQLDFVWLRKNIGYVGQEPVLYATTIRENLLFGKEDATEEEMINALKQANAWEFIQKLENKLDSFVGNSGSQFSGGQKQRICIARAILKNPKILLLDEATSALDRKNEAMIQTTLDEVSKGRTTIVIAHRLTTVQNADTILVLDKGQLVEEGTYETLINSGGIFEALSKNQIQSDMQNEAQQKLLINNINNNEKLNDNQQSDTINKEAINKNNKYKIIENIQDKEDLKNLENLKQHLRSKEQDNKSNNKIKYTKIQIIKKLFEINKPEMGYFYLGLLAAITNGSHWPISGYLLGEYFDVLFNPEKSDFRNRADLLAIGYVIIAIVSLIGYLLQNILFTKVGESLTLRIRKDVYTKMVKMPCSWFDQAENNPGSLSTKLQQDGQYINQITSLILPTQLSNFSCFFVGIGIGFAFSWQVTLIGLAACPLMIACAQIQAQFIQGFSESTDQAYKESGQIIMESVTNIRTVASFCNEQKLHSFISDKLRQPLDLVKRKGQISGVLLGLSSGLIFWIYGVILYWGALFTQEYGISSKDMFIAVFAVLFASFGIGNNCQFMPDIGMALNSATNLLNILNSQDEEQKSQEQAKQFKSNQLLDQNSLSLKGEIELLNVSFKYPSRDVYVLKNISLKIKSGQKVAFVGPSGSGKSSIIQLILRFYDSYEGEILIDGRNIRSFNNIQGYRHNFGVVSQEPVLFSGSIEENIQYNSDNVEFEQIKQAAIQANAYTFITENLDENQLNEQNQKTIQNLIQPNQVEQQQQASSSGFKRNVGLKGSQLSGGQKQRIAIARAIIRNPKILLLDEATSALDQMNEIIVQQALNEIMKGKTSISIAHRLSTIKDSDAIFVIEQGQLVEQGTYEQLMNKKEFFYRLNSN